MFFSLVAGSRNSGRSAVGAVEQASQCLKLRDGCSRESVGDEEAVELGCLSVHWELRGLSNSPLDRQARCSSCFLLVRHFLGVVLHQRRCPTRTFHLSRDKLQPRRTLVLDIPRRRWRRRELVGRRPGHLLWCEALRRPSLTLARHSRPRGGLGRRLEHTICISTAHPSLQQAALGPRRRTRGALAVRRLGRCLKRREVHRSWNRPSHGGRRHQCRGDASLAVTRRSRRD